MATAKGSEPASKADAGAAFAMPIESIVERWCARDQGRAFLGADRDAIGATATVRALIAELLVGRRSPDPAQERDLFHAFGVLGRLLATRGASPTLAATSVDGAREALGADSDAPWVLPSRAALAEGFAAARADLARADGIARWEYPGCSVPLHEGIIAIAAGYPEDDEDALAAWAARVASAAAIAGARRAVISGSTVARAVLAETLGVAGIELLGSYEVVKTRSARS